MYIFSSVPIGSSDLNHQFIKLKDTQFFQRILNDGYNQYF